MSNTTPPFGNCPQCNEPLITIADMEHNSCKDCWEDFVKLEEPPHWSENPAEIGHI